MKRAGKFSTSKQVISELQKIVLFSHSFIFFLVSTVRGTKNFTGRISGLSSTLCYTVRFYQRIIKNRKNKKNFIELSILLKIVLYTFQFDDFLIRHYLLFVSLESFLSNHCCARIYSPSRISYAKLLEEAESNFVAAIE